MYAIVPGGLQYHLKTGIFQDMYQDRAWYVIQYRKHEIFVASMEILSTNVFNLRFQTN